VACRCPFPLYSRRSISQTAVGCLAAPYGHISIAFMTAVGIPTLMAWDGAVCREALAMYKVCCIHQ
jgi:hypothetical protein